MPELILIALINLYISWRYAMQPLGPDEGNWMLWGWTGAKPYKEFSDCKPPGIHAWMWFLSKITGKSIPWSKFIHHAVIGGLVVWATAVSGSPGLGLLATAILQSSRLFAFQSWMDAMSGALLLCGMILPPIHGIWLIGLAVCFNVKVAVPGAVYMALMNAWLPLGIGAGSGLLVLLLYRILFPSQFDAMIYNVFTIPARMKKARRWQLWGPYQMIASMFVVIAVGVAVASGIDLPVGVAALAYTAFNAWGKVWRPNHYLPLAMIVAHSRPDPTLAFVVLLADAISANLYWGYVWNSVYPGIAEDLLAAKKIGEGIADMDGALWVDAFHTQVYVYAGKKPYTGMVEQLEIRDVTPELRTRRDAALRAQRPDLVVVGPGRIPNWEPRGFSSTANVGNFYLLTEANHG